MANSQLAKQIIDNQQQAAITQQALLNNRRVIRRPFSNGHPDFAADDHQSAGLNQSQGQAEAGPESEAGPEAEPEARIIVPPAAETTVEPEPKKRRSRKTGTLPAEVADPSSSQPPEALPMLPVQFENKQSNVVPFPNTAITLSPLDLPTEQFRESLDRRKQNRNLLMQWLSMAMVDDIDYGRIHVVGKDRCQLVRMGKAKDCMDPNHWSKPCLFKPGAEKITGMLGMTVHYPSLRDYESAALAKAELQVIVLRCELHDAYGNVVAEGIGARDLRQDWGDVNKSLKMAAKSAHIDATLRLAGISAMFTQDLEDKPPVPNLDAGFDSDPERGDRFDEPPEFPPFVSSKQIPPATTRTPAPVKPMVNKAKALEPNPEPSPKPEPAPVHAKPVASVSGSGSDDDTKLVNRADLANLRKAADLAAEVNARKNHQFGAVDQGALRTAVQATRAMG